MGINFVVARTIDEAKRIRETVRLDDHIQEFIWKYRFDFGNDIKILFEIDPYDNTICSMNQVSRLLISARRLKKDIIINSLEKEFIIQNVDKNELIDFANDLIKTCEFALEYNRKIVSLGD